jgi:hypothetical protein
VIRAELHGIQVRKVSGTVLIVREERFLKGVVVVVTVEWLSQQSRCVNFPV